MQTIIAWVRRLLFLLVSAALAASPAFADKPEWAGKGKGHDQREQGERGQSRKNDRERHERSQTQPAPNAYFVDQHRGYVLDYYGGEYRRGHCPPGLSKKNNGCMPPGQAKKWHRGKPLPASVVYYEVPPALVVRIGAPPAGHRYVRVAADILLIAVGTGMVVDAIQDLGRM